MARTLLDLANRVCDELDENKDDYNTITKVKKFINTIYKQVAKREGLEKYVEVSVTNYLITKPSDYFRVSKVIYVKELDYEEQEDKILVPTNGDMTLYYYYIPDDLTDSQEPLTNEANDDLIVSGTKFLYLQSENQYNKAEAHNRDYNTLPVKKTKKVIQFKVER